MDRQPYLLTYIVGWSAVTPSRSHLGLSLAAYEALNQAPGYPVRSHQRNVSKTPVYYAQTKQWAKASPQELLFIELPGGLSNCVYTGSIFAQ